MIERSAAASTHALSRRIAQLAELWSIPELAGVVEVRFSKRLTRSLGRADAATGRIALAAFLEEEPALCDAALCHELAHLAAFRLVGPTERPHGPTWRRLVRAAGHEPTLRLLVEANGARPTTRRRHRFTHCCPVCHFTRTAARPMPAWRCADCTAAGLDGRLDITRVERAR
jgi:predicted SprT family Zn-dependent metalloprotease